MQVNQSIKAIAEEAKSRSDLWTRILNELGSESVAEIGVFEGHFSAELLKDCPSITQFTMVDPWRHLDDWDKPSNKGDERHNIRYVDAAYNKYKQVRRSFLRK